MNKTEAVHHTKRANNRLKPVSDTCIRIFNYPDWKEGKKHLMRCFARLDRELGPEDTDGPVLREALEEYRKYFMEHGQIEQYYVEQVYSAVRRVQSQRWRRLEKKYGPVRHYFDGFGQILSKYKKVQEEEKIEAPRGCLVVIIFVVAFFIWWLFF